jgi:Fe2+ or Zn2+ uptake regulation protein
MKKDNGASGAAILLRQAGLKATRARLSILSVLDFPAYACKPLSAEELFVRVRPGLRRRTVDQATVYRNLKSLEKAGIVRRVDLRAGPALYERAEPDHHHHHLVCTDCGAIERFSACGVAPIAERALGESSLFDAVFDHSLELFGVCKRCARA